MQNLSALCKARFRAAAILFPVRVLSQKGKRKLCEWPLCPVTWFASSMNTFGSEWRVMDFYSTQRMGRARTSTGHHMVHVKRHGPSPSSCITALPLIMGVALEINGKRERDIPQKSKHLIFTTLLHAGFIQLPLKLVWLRNHLKKPMLFIYLFRPRIVALGLHEVYASNGSTYVTVRLGLGFTASNYKW